MDSTDEDINMLAQRAAEQLIRYRWKVWFWGDSIGLEGLLDAAELLQRTKYESFVYGLIKGWIGRLEPRRELDYTAAGVSMLRVYEQSQDVQLLEVAKLHGEYLAGFRRTRQGAYLRYLDPDFDLPPELPSDAAGQYLDVTRRNKTPKGGPCLFVDNMHFDAPFYARLFRITGDERWKELAVANIVPQIKLLFDEQSDLFHHFWVEQTEVSNGVFWGRGQGWALLGIVHTLENLEQENTAVPLLLNVLIRHVEALSRAQDSSGHWHTVIDDRNSYLESSVAAFVVDGFSRAMLRGWISSAYRQVIDRAFLAVLQSVGEDGILEGVSYETYPSFSKEHYKTMPKGAMVPWGQGPLLAALRSYRLLQSS